MMPSDMTEFAKYVLTPGGMQAIAGWLISLFAEKWPWFCERDKTEKRLVIWAICGVLGLGAQEIVFWTDLKLNAVYVAFSLAFMVSQVVELKISAQNGVDKGTAT